MTGRFVRRKLALSACILVFSPLANAYWICSEPSEPTIPSGYYAEAYQMESARREVEEYLEEIQEYKECLLRNMEEADSDAESVIDEWNAAVRRYNTR